MTEDEAWDWIARLDGVSRETLDRLDAFADMVVAENQHQNLIGAATVPHIWSRHIADSAQLVAFLADDFDFSIKAGEAGSSPRRRPGPVGESGSASTLATTSTEAPAFAGATSYPNEQNWVDLGSGPGFPGVVTAILTGIPTVLVESRRKRIDFLTAVKERLKLDHVQIAGCRLESLEKSPYSVISARAFAPLPRLFELAHSFSTEKTLWLLPKGRSAREELAMAQTAWQGEFHVKPSLTDPEASIIVATNVRPKRRSR